MIIMIFNSICYWKYLEGQKCLVSNKESVYLKEEHDWIFFGKPIWYFLIHIKIKSYMTI